MDSLKVLGNCCCCSLFSFKSSLCTNYFVSNLSSILYLWFVLKNCPHNHPLHRCIQFDHCDVCISFILLFLYLCPRLLSTVLSQYYYCPPGISGEKGSFWRMNNPLFYFNFLYFFFDPTRWIIIYIINEIQSHYMYIIATTSSWSENRVFDLWTRVWEHNIKLSIEVRLSGNSSFYLVSPNQGPDRYIMYREGRINWSSQRVGLDNCYCNYLAICRYFSK